MYSSIQYHLISLYLHISSYIYTYLHIYLHIFTYIYINQHTSTYIYGTKTGAWPIRFLDQVKPNDSMIQGTSRHRVFFNAQKKARVFCEKKDKQTKRSLCDDLDREKHT